MPRMPDMIAYSVKNRGEGNKAWTSIGAAWKHASGRGFYIELAALPVDGKLMLLPLTPSGAADGGGPKDAPIQPDREKGPALAEVSKPASFAGARL